MVENGDNVHCKLLHNLKWSAPDDLLPALTDVKHQCIKHMFVLPCGYLIYLLLFIQYTPDPLSWFQYRLIIALYTTTDFRMRCSGTFQVHRNYPLKFTFLIVNENDTNVGKLISNIFIRQNNNGLSRIARHRKLRQGDCAYHRQNTQTIRAS